MAFTMAVSEISGSWFGRGAATSDFADVVLAPARSKLP
jgi:hypothetical protein